MKIDLENRQTLRAKEISEIFGVSQSTIWLYVKQGKLKANKVSPGLTLFDIDEVKSVFIGKTQG